MENKYMKITIPKQENSSITEEISIDLGNYTILAGENNSGKTNLIRAIKEHGDLKTYKKIFVPAEHTQPQNEETKSSVAKTDFFKLLKSVVSPLFNKGTMLKSLVDGFNGSTVKNKFVEDVNSILEDFGLKNHEFDIKISDEEFKEEIIIKLIKAFVRDLYKTDITEVDFENIGMGAQRLITAALIRYYEEKKIDENEKVLLIFEEPEVYLHPKWKKGLYDSLLLLSQRENTKVLITTHDPYFIELGKKQTIYRVYRDPSKKDATAVDPIPEPDTKSLLPYKSNSEINYLIFDMPSEEYFIEFYENLKRKAGYDFPKSYADFDNYMFGSYFKAKGVKQDCKDDHGKDCMKITRLRHDIAHGKEISADIKNEIENLIGFFKSIK